MTKIIEFRLAKNRQSGIGTLSKEDMDQAIKNREASFVGFGQIRDNDGRFWKNNQMSGRWQMLDVRIDGTLIIPF